jgi:predicted RNA-binding Zn-ribbon protein involved in translation (DUF1610 family)
VRFSYRDGDMYCSTCGRVLRPLEALLSGFRCPYCGRKVRGDQQAVIESVRRSLDKRALR